MVHGGYTVRWSLTWPELSSQHFQFIRFSAMKKKDDRSYEMHSDITCVCQWTLHFTAFKIENKIKKNSFSLSCALVVCFSLSSYVGGFVVSFFHLRFSAENQKLRKQRKNKRERDGIITTARQQQQPLNAMATQAEDTRCVLSAMTSTTRLFSSFVYSLVCSIRS